MTVERKIVVGLDAVRAVILECRSCRTRVVLSPDRCGICAQCPECLSTWISAVQGNANFLDALSKIRVDSPTVATGPIRILLELDEPELAGRL